MSSECILSEVPKKQSSFLLALGADAQQGGPVEHGTVYLIVGTSQERSESFQIDSSGPKLILLQLYDKIWRLKAFWGKSKKKSTASY